MKRRLSLLLCLLMVLSLVSGAYSTSLFMVDAAKKGDVDANGDITATDYLLMKADIKRQRTYTADELKACDINNDGVVTTADLILIGSCVAGGVILECEHSFGAWVATGDYNCEGFMITERACDLCGVTETSTDTSDSKLRSIDGKNVMFIGNSFVYYGYCVNKGSQTKTDKGYFKQLCTANGDSVNVYDYVWGGRNLDYIYSNYLVDCTSDFLSTIDYVFISEAGENNSGLVSDVQKIINLYPSSKTKFFYLCHSYTYQAGHSNIKNAFSTLQSKGIEVVNWGQLVYNVWKGTETVPGGVMTYNKDSFIVNKNDTYHQNMLSGYITAQMCYSALTGKSAVGQPYAFVTDSSINSNYDTAAYISSYYNSGTTNFDDILASVPDMLGFQVLIDKYLKKYNHTVFSGGKHICTADESTAYDYSLASAGLSAGICSFCGETILSEGGDKGTNLMYISPETIAAAGCATVKDYMLAGHGNVFYQTTVGWGRSGYSSINGMAASCDGVRSSNGLTDGTETHWRVKSLTGAFNANGGTPATGETSYISLIGYDMTNAVTAKGVGIFFNRVNPPKSFDLLGGVTGADGTITWTVLASFDSASQSYMKYDDTTVAFFADFDAATFDCVQLGLKSIDKVNFFTSELELYK
ncbi:MAG: dockerin type I repeat-containing protein [Clostridia bacterium]|nr:dockerin type I repeat-containing protein [Clostridia bacterium]